MAARNLQLRLKTREGQFDVNSLNSDNSIGELKAIIWSLTKVHPDECHIKIGFPPTRIDLSDDERPIGQVIANSREVLTLEQSSGSGNQNNAAPKKITQVVPPKLTIRREVVDADNSCLFVSVYIAMTGQLNKRERAHDPRCANLRKLIVDTVKNDPLTFNEGFLGKPNLEYCTWISNENHWGGGIELSILAKFFATEIVAVDTQHVRLNRFGEDQNYSERIFLIFDGIHYDPLVVESNDVNNPIQTKFSTHNQTIMDMALEYARVQMEKHQYTDVQRMQLRCNQCHKEFSQEDAKSHANTFHHLEFSEITN